MSVRALAAELLGSGGEPRKHPLEEMTRKSSLDRARTETQSAGEGSNLREDGMKVFC